MLLSLAAAIAFCTSLDGRLLDYQPSKLILDRRGHYLGEVPGEGEQLGYWPPPYVLPPKIVVATLETEDRGFFQHPGVSVRSVGRAAWQNARNGRVISGASTIAMQVARLQRGRGPRTALRKATEAAGALLLVHRHGHERVLRQYLTVAPYGNRARGVVRAARLYFDKPVEDLSWLQAAFLAGLPQQPGKMNPYSEDGLRRGLARARRILRALHARGHLSGDELRVALSSELGLVPLPHRRPEAMHAVLHWSERARGRKEATLTATLDLGVQRQVARILGSNLAALRPLGAGTSAALVVDTSSGDVLAYLGSPDFFSEEDRGAIDYLQVKRSPGSALKPFIYALAMERGRLTAATELPDTRLEVQSDDGRAYLPENISHNYLGPMLARQALANSRNIPAMRVLSSVGVEPVLQLLERGGVSGVSYQPDRYGLGLAIGNLEVTVEEAAALYGALASGGELVPFRRFSDEAPAPRRRLISREAAQMVTHILADREARRPMFAAGGPLDFDYAVAAKTGTSQGHRDAWAIGTSDRLLVAVWVGNHDRRRMNHVTGAGAAATAMHRIMDAVMPHREPYRPIASAFPLPERYAARQVCPLSGKLAGPNCPERREEAFAPGLEPTYECSYHVTMAVDARNGLRAGPRCPEDYVVYRSMLSLPEEYDDWAKSQRLELAPRRQSPLCPSAPPDESPSVAIAEPKDRARFLFDPNTPAEVSTLRLSAKVIPPTERVVWLVDGAPVARVGHPHELRWPLEKGTHVIQAMLDGRPFGSRPVTVVVDD
ncbi:MAG: transglycosylase domain-containing protein [Myxococcales bacterium]|nr:transglycosylase domain-containing protein [Myxococcales bacterium]